MRYVSLFSGIEAASVAWRPLGWEPLAFSEIEPFPSAVLAHHYLNTPNLGDITKIDWNQHADCLTADLVVGGSPCQSFSIAGRREGLEGASGLMWEYVRAVQAIRPRWLVWENVPGALSSSGGEDFRCLLESLDELGYCLAWRVLDAQYFGVAQRRRRVFLVGSLGSTRACEVLFEPESLRWDHPSGRAKRQALTRAIGSGARGADADRDGLIYSVLLSQTGAHGRNWRTDCAYTLDCAGPSAVALDFNPTASRLRYADEDVSQTLTARMGTGGNQVPLVQETHAFLPNNGGKACGIAYEHELSPTLKTEHNPAVVCRPATMQIRAGKPGGGKGPLIQDDMSATLTVAQTQTLFPGDGTVRRLMPVECERLQGFPDSWSDVPYKGKDHAPDSPRYKALGNSMAVPVMRWIGWRIQQVEEAAHDVA